MGELYITSWKQSQLYKFDYSSLKKDFYGKIIKLKRTLKRPKEIKSHASSWIRILNMVMILIFHKLAFKCNVISNKSNRLTSET